MSVGNQMGYKNVKINVWFYLTLASIKIGDVPDGTPSLNDRLRWDYQPHEVGGGVQGVRSL